MEQEVPEPEAKSKPLTNQAKRILDARRILCSIGTSALTNSDLGPPELEQLATMKPNNTKEYYALLVKNDLQNLEKSKCATLKSHKSIALNLTALRTLFSTTKTGEIEFFRYLCDSFKISRR